MPAKISVKKIILVLWLVFSILYVGWNEWSRFKSFVMQRSYSQGVADAVGQVIEQGKTCKSFPVNVGENKTTLISIECLQKAQETK